MFSRIVADSPRSCLQLSEAELLEREKERRILALADTQGAPLHSLSCADMTTMIIDFVNLMFQNDSCQVQSKICNVHCTFIIIIALNVFPGFVSFKLIYKRKILPLSCAVELLSCSGGYYCTKKSIKTKTFFFSSQDLNDVSLDVIYIIF